MLIRQHILAGIRDGSISLQFRKWRRPTVKAGGTLLTAIGQLAVEAIDIVDPTKISAADAKRAGFAAREELRAELQKHGAGDVYRVRLRLLGEDPRRALRQHVPEGEELQALVARVKAFDARSKGGPWAVAALKVIAERPAVRAGDLADDLRMPRDDFKAKVRKLKALGLTESLEVGYRLSPRGEAVCSSLGAGR